jgi:hypothetical protein
MSDGQVLFLVLVAIYLSDCLIWVRHDAVAFVAPSLRRWRLRRPSATFGNERGGVVLVNPLPPLGRIYVCPLVPAGLLPETPAWPEEDSRPAAEAALARALDTEAVARGVAEQAQISGPLQISCNLLLAYLLGLAPLAAWLHGLEATLGGILAGLALMLALAVGQWWLLHRKAFPERRFERRLHAFLMLIAPPGAIRAHDALSRDALAGFHPLAVARVLLPPQRFEAFARRTLLELRHPEPGAELPGLQAPLLAACERLVRDAGLDLEALLAPPAPEEGCRSYCPRCRTQYALNQGRCSECVEQLLVAFPQPLASRPGL